MPKFDKKDFKYIKNSVRFCPDNIVFIDTIIPVLDKHQNIDSFNNNLIFIKDFGFFSLKNANKNVEEQIQFYFDDFCL